MWCARKSRQNRRVNRKLTQPGGGRMAGIGPIGRIGLMDIALHKQRSNLAPTALQSSAATEAARASTATADSLAPPPGCDLGATFTRPRMSPTPRSAKSGLRTAATTCRGGGLLRLLSSSHHRAAFGGSHTHHRTTAPP